MQEIWTTQKLKTVFPLDNWNLVSAPVAKFKQHGGIVAEKNCPLQKDWYIKFKIAFRFQYKAAYYAFYLRILQYINGFIRILIVKPIYYA